MNVKPKQHWPTSVITLADSPELGEVPSKWRSFVAGQLAGNVIPHPVPEVEIDSMVEVEIDQKRAIQFGLPSAVPQSRSAMLVPQGSLDPSSPELHQPSGLRAIRLLGHASYFVWDPEDIEAAFCMKLHRNDLEDHLQRSVANSEWIRKRDEKTWIPEASALAAGEDEGSTGIIVRPLDVIRDALDRGEEVVSLSTLLGESKEDALHKLKRLESGNLVELDPNRTFEAHAADLEAVMHAIAYPSAVVEQAEVLGLQPDEWFHDEFVQALARYEAKRHFEDHVIGGDHSQNLMVRLKDGHVLGFIGRDSDDASLDLMGRGLVEPGDEDNALGGPIGTCLPFGFHPDEEYGPQLEFPGGFAQYYLAQSLFFALDSPHSERIVERFLSAYREEAERIVAEPLTLPKWPQLLMKLRSSPTLDDPVMHGGLELGFSRTSTEDSSIQGALLMILMRHQVKRRDRRFGPADVLRRGIDAIFSAAHEVWERRFLARPDVCRELEAPASPADQEDALILFRYNLRNDFVQRSPGTSKRRLESRLNRPPSRLRFLTMGDDVFAVDDSRVLAHTQLPRERRNAADGGGVASSTH